MTTSSPILHSAERDPSISRSLITCVGIAQTFSPEARSSLTEIYLGVPSWLFVPVGVYQIAAAVMILIPKRRVSGAVHVGIISLVSVGFSFFGDGILNLIPLGVATAVLAFIAAGYFRLEHAQPADR